MTGCEDGAGCSRYLELINASSPRGNSVQKSSSTQHNGLPEVWPHGSVPRAWPRPPGLKGEAKASAVSGGRNIATEKKINLYQTAADDV